VNKPNPFPNSCVISLLLNLTHTTQFVLLPRHQFRPELQQSGSARCVASYSRGAVPRVPWSVGNAPGLGSSASRRIASRCRIARISTVCEAMISSAKRRVSGSLRGSEPAADSPLRARGAGSSLPGNPRLDFQCNRVRARRSSFFSCRHPTGFTRTRTAKRSRFFRRI
jgi:hypothetical protein